MKKRTFTRYTLFVCIIAALGGLLFGYNATVISGVLLFVSQQFSFTTFQQEIIVSTLIVGAFLGAGFGGMLADKIGRKKTLLLTTILFAIGTVLLMVSQGMGSLLIGRFVSGFAIGIASLAVPLYIAEMSDPDHRGALVSLNQLAITIGILLSYGIDYAFSSDDQWRLMFGFALIPAILMFVGLFFIPETPSFLVANGKIEKATKVLKKITTNKASLESLNELEEGSKKKLVNWQTLLSKSIRPALIVGILVSVFQQITGINTVIYYAPKIFQFAGFQSASSAILASLGIGVVNVIVTIIALWIIDIVGRRLLLIVGIIGMVVSLSILGMAFFISAASIGSIAVVSLMSYVAFFAIGLGPVAWLIISEIYPLGVRGRAMGIATFANWVCNYIVSLTFLSLIDFLGTAGAFWLYAVIGLIALWFVCKRVPETKGKTLQQIQKYWKHQAEE
jgi:MFS transporter, SP family, galactose:H+ symporter